MTRASGALPSVYHSNSHLPLIFPSGAVKQHDNIQYPWAMGEFGPMESESTASYIAPRSFSSAKFAYPQDPINYDFEPLEHAQNG